MPRHEAYFTVRELKKQYQLAVKEKREGFVIQGCQFHTAYAKYLLEHLGNQKVPLSQRLCFTQKEEESQ